MEFSFIIYWLVSSDAHRWMPQNLTDDKSALVEVMAWCRQATSHYLNQCWPRSLPPYGVTRPQWVNEGAQVCTSLEHSYVLNHDAWLRWWQRKCYCKQKDSNAENASIWWRHHANKLLNRHLYRVSSGNTSWIYNSGNFWQYKVSVH